MSLSELVKVTGPLNFPVQSLGPLALWSLSKLRADHIKGRDDTCSCFTTKLASHQTCNDSLQTMLGHTQDNLIIQHGTIIVLEDLVESFEFKYPPLPNWEIGFIYKDKKYKLKIEDNKAHRFIDDDEISFGLYPDPDSNYILLRKYFLVALLSVGLDIVKNIQWVQLASDLNKLSIVDLVETPIPIVEEEKYFEGNPEDLFDKIRAAFKNSNKIKGLQ